MIKCFLFIIILVITILKLNAGNAGKHGPLEKVSWDDLQIIAGI